LKKVPCSIKEDRDLAKPEKGGNSILVVRLLKKRWGFSQSQGEGGGDPFHYHKRRRKILAISLKTPRKKKREGAGEGGGGGGKDMPCEKRSPQAL